MLGRDVLEVFQRQQEVLATSRRAGFVHLDVTDPSEVEQLFATFRPEIVVHCAAMTQVDECERNPEAAFRVNAHGSAIIASACHRYGSTLIFISTDYVFDGSLQRPYHEYDQPNPLNVYGRSKWQGEQAVQAFCARHLIVRTAWLYGRHGNCFPKKIMESARQGKALRVVADQIGSPTFTRDLAEALLRLLEVQVYGVYHVVNLGTASWYELACETLHLAGLDAEIEPITSDAWSTPTRRPPYSALTSFRWNWLGLPPLRPWQKALREFVEAMRQER